MFDFVDGGTNSVALFFVLSGFILTYNYASLSGRSETTKYLVSRFARVWPVAVLAVALGSVGVVYASQHPGLMRDWYSVDGGAGVYLAASFVAQILMVTAWAPFAAIQGPWNGPAWSIACEAFFYALFPFLLGRLRSLSTRTVVLTALVVWVLQFLWIALLWRVNDVEPRAYWLIIRFPVTHLPEFVMGVCAGLWFLSNGSSLTTRRRNGLLAAALVGVTVFSLWRPVTPNHLMLSPFLTLLIVALAAPTCRRTSWLAWGPIVLLGEASYSLYMTHVPLMHIYEITGTNSVGRNVVALLLIVALSVVTFRAYEAPLRIVIRRRIGVRKAPAELQ